ncbi:hypothetical protein Tco_0674088 [Tanacetum coccineum]
MVVRLDGVRNKLTFHHESHSQNVIPVMAEEDAFLLTTLKVVYVLTTPMPKLMEDDTVEAIRRRAKWENNDYMSVKEQFNELLKILGQYTQHGLKMDESISVSSVIDKLPLSWKDFKHTLKHGKDDLSLVQLGSHLRIEESLWAQDRDKGKDRCWFKTYEPVEDGFVIYMGDDRCAPVHGKGRVVLKFSSGKSITLFNVLYIPKLRKNLISGPVLNKCGYKQVYESDKYILSKSGVFVGFGYYNNGHVHYKRMLEMSKDDLIPAIDENPEKCTTCMAVVRLPGPKRKTLGEKGIDCIFVGYVEHSKAYRPKDIIPNSDESQRDDHSNDVLSETPKPHRVLRRILEPIVKLCNLEMLLFEKK